MGGSSFQYLKRGECPICQGTREDCRKSTRSGLIHCRDDSVTTVPGWRFVKQDALGFNLWAIDDARDRQWSEERLEEWKREREIQRQQWQAKIAQRLAELLSVEERDRQYRLVNENLRLITRHRKALRDERKLTDSEIDLAIKLGALRTWNRPLSSIGTESYAKTKTLAQRAF